jgi:uncharacterized LabA/DUF88 family protein
MPVQPTIPQFMAFIDGENLTFRYQAMCNDGRVPYGDVVHRQDEFVWRSQFGVQGLIDVKRANYYTSAVGDEPKVAELCSFIRKTRFCQNAVAPIHVNLVPSVFKKVRASEKISTVDVQLAVDAMTHSSQSHVDGVILCTGDSDFVPLAEAIMRLGKRLYIHAFSNGLSPRIASLGDEFISLDPVFFK